VLGPEALEAAPDDVDGEPDAVGDLLLGDRVVGEALERREDRPLGPREGQGRAPVGGLPLTLGHERPRGAAD
jgi:hypothetical protein